MQVSAIWLHYVSLLLQGVHEVGGRCPDTLELMGRSDTCLSALQSPTNGTLVGGLTPETKPTVCK